MHPIPSLAPCNPIEDGIYPPLEYLCAYICAIWQNIGAFNRGAGKIAIPLIDMWQVSQHRRHFLVG
jgi:hypothetical protein